MKRLIYIPKEMRVVLWLLALPVAVLINQVFFVDNWYSNAIPPDNISELVWGDTKLSKFEQEKLNQVLHQPFQFLDEGGQSYVFVSEDGKYVLKFFKFHRFRTQRYIDYIPNLSFFTDYKESHITRRKDRLEAVYRGHQITYDVHKDESGLLFMQLKPSDSSKEISIIDRKGRKRKIDLSKVAFVLQERGEILSVIFGELLDSGKVDSVKDKVVKTLSLYRDEYLKGIYDTDHGVMHNIGFVGEKPIHIDVGNFVKDEKFKQQAYYRKDWVKVSNKIKQWVDKNYPQYNQEIALTIDEQLEKS